MNLDAYKFFVTVTLLATSNVAYLQCSSLKIIGRSYLHYLTCILANTQEVAWLGM